MIEKLRFAWKSMRRTRMQTTCLIKKKKMNNDIQLFFIIINLKKLKFVETRMTKNFMRLFLISKIENIICKITNISFAWLQITIIFVILWIRKNSTRNNFVELKNWLRLISSSNITKIFSILRMHRQKNSIQSNLTITKITIIIYFYFAKQISQSKISIRYTKTQWRICYN